jgi:hypothetical protein
LIRIRTYIILFLFTVCFADGTDDDTPPNSVSRVATAAANWLKIETGTKAIAMAGTHTAVGSGLVGVPYNPANITFVKSKEGFFSTTKHFADITHNVLGYAYNMSGTDFASLHIFFLDSGSMPRTLEEYNTYVGTGETFSATALCLRATYGRIITNRLRIGFTGKYIREQIYTTFMQSFAFDIGSNFDTGLYGFKLGMSVSNLGPEVNFEGEGFQFQCDPDLEDECPADGVAQYTAESFAIPNLNVIGSPNDSAVY